MQYDIDLDQPNELFDRKSNKINIISDNADRNATPNVSESEDPQ